MSNTEKDQTKKKLSIQTNKKFIVELVCFLLDLLIEIKDRNYGTGKNTLNLCMDNSLETNLLPFS